MVKNNELKHCKQTCSSLASFQRRINTTKPTSQAKKIHACAGSCTCVGLGTSALLAYNLDTKTEGEGVSICPGPNLAYYSKIMSLKSITDHIYGRANVISRTDRPNMFIKELQIYMDYLKNKLKDAQVSMTKKEEKYLKTFTSNMKEGISYYSSLFKDVKHSFEDKKLSVLKELELNANALQQIVEEIENLILVPVKA